MKRKLRSLWAGTPILNVIHNSRAETLLGIQSETLVFHQYHTTSDFTFNLSAWCRFRWAKFLVPILVFPWALFRYDIFHFFFDRGILPSWKWQGIRELELKILKWFKKKVFVYTYGADIRTRKITQALGKYNCCMDCPSVGKACVCSEEKFKQTYQRVEKYASKIFSMGDMTEYTPNSDNSLFFWPINVTNVQYRGVSKNASAPVKIVHAPNHRHFKGTQYLLEAVQRLKKEGLLIELHLVEKMPNDQALKMYSEADIVAEQFIIGWHGFTAIEAMALGKPVICYLRKQNYLLAPEECPIVSANPENLDSVLRDLIQDCEKRIRLGKQGRQYVEKYFSLEAFAARLKKIYIDQGILDPDKEQCIV